MTLVVAAVPLEGLAPAVGGGVKVGTGATFAFMIPAVIFILAFGGFIASVVPMMGAGMMTETVLLLALIAIFLWTLVLGHRRRRRWCGRCLLDRRERDRDAPGHRYDHSAKTEADTEDLSANTDRN